MEYNEIKEKVIHILNSNMNMDIDNQDIQKKLLDENSQFDSLSLLQTLVELELEFDIELYDDELSYESFTSVENIIQIVMKHIKQDELIE